MRWKWIQWLASAQLAHSGNGKFSVNLRNSFVFWMTPFPIWKLIKILHSIYILCCCQSVFIVPKMEWNVFLCWQFRCYWCQIERVSLFDSFIYAHFTLLYSLIVHEIEIFRGTFILNMEFLFNILRMKLSSRHRSISFH